MKFPVSVLAHVLLLTSLAWADAPSGQPAVSPKPVTLNGLSVTTAVSKKAFAADEPISITVEIMNVTDKDIPLYRTSSNDLKFIDLTTKKAWVTQASLFPSPASAFPTPMPCASSRARISTPSGPSPQDPCTPWR